ncbi:hypothetical protein EV702DRAFT_1047265 [Suillus placidus]|uniref:Uncharacterized protein n=1 Tax=Suillus placidus TaxID=48579 RepID=A0A9P6ZQL5_9AGAM|nr:hypothetical protein EV702DRAFT_1047265 [Suillus placidus]
MPVKALMNFAFESGTLRENTKFLGSHAYLGNYMADYTALNAYQYQTFGNQIKHIHPFQLHYTLSCTFSHHTGSTPKNHFHFGSPILPHDACRAVAHFHAAFAAANNLKLPSTQPSVNAGLPTILPSPLCLGRRPLSPLSLGEGTLTCLEDAPVSGGQEINLLRVPIEPLQQPTPPTTTLPAQATLIPATGHPAVGDPRLMSRPAEAFVDTRPTSSVDLEAQCLPFVPALANHAPTPFPGPPPPPNTTAPSRQLLPLIEAYNFCIIRLWMTTTFFVEEDTSGLTTPGPYGDPQLPLGNILIAADHRAVSFINMPNFLPYVSFDPISNAMIADPPTYDTAIQAPFRGVHCGRNYRANIPFNSIYRASPIHTLNLTATLITTESMAHTTCEVGLEQAKFLAVRPPSIYHFNKPQYPGAVVRGQTCLQNWYFEWRNFRHLHLDLITAVHSTLTPEQSRDCNEVDICLILIEADKVLPAWLTVPDEDVMYILLQELLLDDLFRTNIKPLANLGTIFATHERRHQQDFAVFRPEPVSAYEGTVQYENNGAYGV